MKKLYLFLNKHMRTLAVIWAACLLPVAVAPAFIWVVECTAAESVHPVESDSQPVSM